MNAVPLQTRILEVIGRNQPLNAKELGKHLNDVDPGALDIGITALMRANKVTLLGGHYDLAAARTSNKPAERAEAPPTAAEEAAASLGPEKRVCEDCKTPKPIADFQFVRGENRSKICRGCMGRRAQNGRLQAQFAKPTAKPPEPPVPIVYDSLTKLQRKRDALIAAREQLTAEYEAKLKAVIDQAAEINHVLAEVKRLSEEVV